MNALLHQQVLLIYLSILIFAALPLWAWRPSRPLFGPQLALFGLFSWPTWGFIWADVGAWHDHEQNLQKQLELANQWLSWGRELGWLPYLGGGMPYALFNNLINVPEILLFSKLSTLWAAHLSDTQTYNLGYLISFFGFATGAVMLMLLLFESYRAALLGAVTLVLGGLFVHDLAQPKAFTVLFAFVWPAFFILLTLKTKKPGAAVLAILAFGGMANYYVPPYGLYAFFACVLSGLIFYGSGLRPLNQFKPLVKSPVAWVLAVFCSVAIILPVGYSLLEMQGYYSPSRGSVAGTVDAGNTGAQPVYHAEMKNLAVLVWNQAVGDHAGFFIGLPILLLVPLALLSRRGLFLALPTVFLGLLSQGRETALWDFAVTYWPLMSYARHAFHFGVYLSFFLMLMGIEGALSYSREEDWKRRWALLAGSAAVVFFWVGKVWPETWELLDFWPWGWLLVLAVWGGPWPRNTYRAYAGMAFVMLHAGFLLIEFNHSVAERHHRAPEHNLSGFVYPHHFYYLLELKPNLPFYLRPVMLKQTEWYALDPAYLFFVQPDFHRLLERLHPLDEVRGRSAPVFKLLLATRENEVNDPDWVFREIRDDLKQEVSVRWGTKVSGLEHGEFHCPQPELCLEVSPDPNQQELTVDLDRPSLLWRRENWHRGWRVEVEGEEKELRRGAYNLQYLELPPGKHRVRFVYSDPYHQILQFYLAVVVLGWFGKLWWLKRNKEI